MVWWRRRRRRRAYETLAPAWPETEKHCSRALHQILIRWHIAEWSRSTPLCWHLRKANVEWWDMSGRMASLCNAFFYSLLSLRILFIFRGQPFYLKCCSKFWTRVAFTYMFMWLGKLRDGKLYFEYSPKSCEPREAVGEKRASRSQRRDANAVDHLIIYVIKFHVRQLL